MAIDGSSGSRSASARDNANTCRMPSTGALYNRPRMSCRRCAISLPQAALAAAHLLTELVALEKYTLVRGRAPRGQPKVEPMSELSVGRRPCRLSHDFGMAGHHDYPIVRWFGRWNPCLSFLRSGDSCSTLNVFEARHELAHRDSKGGTPILDLDNVKTALAAFAFAHECLGHAQSRRELDLRHSYGLPDFAQSRNKETVLLRVNGFFHRWGQAGTNTTACSPK